MIAATDIYTLLKDKFGYDEFRAGQKTLVCHIINGKDVVGVMPTGAGKSICFQLPALMLPGITLVISPLISLMKDQVESLLQNGIAATFLNSSLEFEEYKSILRNARKGKYKLIYIAPERLDTESFSRFVEQVNISLIAVDEAHCVSQWGQDFRPSYLAIAPFVKSLNQRPVVAAFTATATKKVKDDICRLLELENPFCLTTGFDRKNLYFEVLHVDERDKTAMVLKLLSKQDAKSVIIYCATRKKVESLTDVLQREGYRTTQYHAGLHKQQRLYNQEDFIFDRTPIIVATNAFGMGIDKSDISLIIHYNMPKNLESYYQEAGRAGRDGEPAKCVLMYSPSDVVLNQYFINNTHNELLTQQQKKDIEKQDYKNLACITEYCTMTECLRKYILNYFGEQSEDCGNCGNCSVEFDRINFTIQAQKIFSCIVRMRQRFGMKIVCDVLRGSKNKRVLELKFNQLSTYGLLDQVKEADLKTYIRELVYQGYLRFTGDEFPVLKLTSLAESVLYGDEEVYIKKRKRKKLLLTEKKKAVKEHSALYQNLLEFRSKTSKEQGVPAYIVFSDRTMHDICRVLPTSFNEMLKITGIGQKKLEQYGNQILAMVKQYLSNTPQT